MQQPRSTHLIKVVAEGQDNCPVFEQRNIPLDPKTTGKRRKNNTQKNPKTNSVIDE